MNCTRRYSNIGLREVLGSFLYLLIYFLVTRYLEPYLPDIKIYISYKYVQFYNMWK